MAPNLRFILFNLLPLFTAILAARKPSNALLLSSVKSLTFYDGKMTTGRRLDPIPQLTCVGGSAQKYFKPEVIQCKNAGSSYSAEDIDWTCTASLPNEFKLGSTEVVCEGYESAEDDHVLKGSCALEYRLILTDAGEEKYGKAKKFFASSSSSQTRIGGGDFPPVSLLFWMLFIGVIGWMLYKAYNNATGNHPRGRGSRGGGGGEDGGDDDPPPPYSPRKAKPKVTHSSASAPHAANRNANQAWRPGFWTGAAAGAAGGYLAANRNNRQSAPPQPQMQQQPSSNWWGGYQDSGEGSSNGRMRGAASSSTFSSERHTSTGFGGTRRR